jgi:hypothetical protein
MATITSIGWAFGRGPQPTDTVAIDDPNDAAAEAEDPADDQPDDPLTPRRILIDGLTLEHVQMPADPAFQGDDDFIDRITGSVNTDQSNPLNARQEEIVIFADADDPFGGPILGLNLLAGGGFQPWGLNLGDMDVTDLTRSLVRDGDRWTLDPSAGLVEVARVSGSWDLFRFGWQFDFGPDYAATWQAEAHNGNGVWLWIARLADSRPNSPAPTVRPIEVLGNQGLILDQGDPDGTGADDEVIWVDGDLTYRLTVGIDQFDNTASAAVPRLRIVDNGTWDAAVSSADGRFRTEPVFWYLNLAMVIAAVALAILFARNARWWPATGLVLGAVAWFFLIDSGSLRFALVGWVGLAVIAQAQNFWPFGRLNRRAVRKPVPERGV